MSESEFLTVRCSSCNRKIGLATSENTVRFAVFCDPWCAREIRATPMEERNDEWRVLALMGMSPIRIAKIYGVHHPLVYKVLSRA